MQLVSDSSKVDGLQDLYDLALLRKLADLHDAEWTEVFKMLDLKIAEVREQVRHIMLIEPTSFTFAFYSSLSLPFLRRKMLRQSV